LRTEKVALLVSDYVSFANVLIDLSKRLIANAYDDNNISQVDLVKKLLSIIKKKKNKKAKASDKLNFRNLCERRRNYRQRAKK
jgi:hypothetical protein